MGVNTSRWTLKETLEPMSDMARSEKKPRMKLRSTNTRKILNIPIPIACGFS